MVSYVEEDVEEGRVERDDMKEDEKRQESDKR